MIYSSLAVLALAASALIPSASAAPSLGSLVHLHPHTQQDSRVSVVLYNSSISFVDVKIDGHKYTVMPHATLGVKAPAGTAIYTGSFMPFHKVGDQLFALTPAMNRQQLELR